MNNIIDMKPRYFDEKKEIQIFVEYLIDNDDTIHKTLAKEIGGVSGEPYDIVPNKYGGYDYIYKRPSKKGTVEVIIKDHVTGHPNRGMSRHINVHNRIDNKQWHVFYLGG